MIIMIIVTKITINVCITHRRSTITMATNLTITLYLFKSIILSIETILPDQDYKSMHGILYGVSISYLGQYYYIL